MALELDRLNPRQREAVTAPSMPLLVLAGPGTGKTTVLSWRIAYLVACGQVDPRDVLAVTFTNRAARALRARVRGLCPAADASRIGTLHSLGLRLLRQWAHRLGYDPHHLTILERDDGLTLVRDVLADLGLDEDLWPVEDVAAGISAWKRAGGWTEAPDEPFAAIRQGVVAASRRHNLVDFDDLISLPLGLLLEDPDVLAWAQDRFPVVVVDEAQDLDTAQYRLISLLARRERRLTAVGDPMQTIFAWRGATLRPLADLRRDFPDLRTIALEQCYRSTETILDLAASLGGLLPDGRRRLWTSRGKGATVTVALARDESAEAAFVADALIRLRRMGALSRWSDGAVLYRARQQGEAIARTFDAAGIPCRRTDGSELLKTREVGDLLAYLRLVANPADTPALARAINRPPRGLAVLERALRERRLRSLDDVTAQGPRLLTRRSAREKLDAFLDVVHELALLAQRVAPAELLAATREQSGYAAWLAAQADGSCRQQRLDIL
jgi:DNA helicase-2/ATP-dependent DNA helicase PcrA